jgi:hypothetical protein
MVDISILIKETENIATQIFAVCKDMQKKIYENQLIREDVPSIDEGSRTPRVAINKAQSTTGATPRIATKVANVKSASRDRGKRRSTYDENKAAALFGGHAVEDLSSDFGDDGSNAPDGDSDNIADVAEGSADVSGADNSKLNKSSSLHVLPPTTGRSSVSAGNSPAVGRSVSTSLSTPKEGSQQSSPREAGVSRGRSMRKENSKEGSGSKSKTHTPSMLKMATGHHGRRASSGGDEADGGVLDDNPAGDNGDT